MMELALAINEVIVPDFRPTRTIRVTPLRYETIGKMRSVLIDVARARRTITYGNLRDVIESRYPERAFGPLLDLLSIDCERRDGPSLAALVVRADTGEVGDEFMGDAASGRAECYTYWSR